MLEIIGQLALEFIFYEAIKDTLFSYNVATR